MSFGKSRVASLLVALSLVGVAPLHGQVSVGLDAGLYTHYVWRGITFTSDPVIQQDFWLEYAGFTGGFWSNVEVVPAGQSALAIRGAGNRGVSEIDYWLEYGFSFEKADLSVGAVYYTYHGLPDIGDGNTAEVYANVTLTALPVEPSLAVFYDLDNVRGAYFEGSVGYSVPVGSGHHSLDLGVLGGFSAGQETNSVVLSQAANFVGKGLTHLDFSAGTELNVGALAVSPAVHFMINSDESTWVTGLAAGQQATKTKIWFGASVGWSRIVGGH